MASVDYVVCFILVTLPGFYSFELFTCVFVLVFVVVLMVVLV